MILRKDCELVEVVYQNDNKKAVLRFLDVENGMLLEVNFNKQVYENNGFVDNKEKSEKVEEWSKEYFDTTFDKLSTKVGEKKDIYSYDNFNALWKVKETKKFEKDDIGKMFTAEITKIEDDGLGVYIYFEIEEEEYSAKMMYADYIEVRKEWFVNPQKQKRQYEKFEDKFGVKVEDREEIVGKEIMLEVKLAFGKFPYADIKKPNWK